MLTLHDEDKTFLEKEFPGATIIVAGRKNYREVFRELNCEDFKVIVLTDATMMFTEAFKQLQEQVSNTTMKPYKCQIRTLDKSFPMYKDGIELKKKPQLILVCGKTYARNIYYWQRTKEYHGRSE